MRRIAKGWVMHPGLVSPEKYTWDIRQLILFCEACMMQQSSQRSASDERLMSNLGTILVGKAGTDSGVRHHTQPHEGRHRRSPEGISVQMEAVCLGGDWPVTGTRPMLVVCWLSKYRMRERTGQGWRRCW